MDLNAPVYAMSCADHGRGPCRQRDAVFRCFCAQVPRAGRSRGHLQVLAQRRSQVNKYLDERDWEEGITIIHFRLCEESRCCSLLLPPPFLRSSPTRLPNRTFPIAELWDHRLRTYYKARYDSRVNMADWDYSMNLRCVFKVGTSGCQLRYATWPMPPRAFLFPGIKLVL